MIRDWKLELYWRLPIAVQELALSAYAWRLDRLYYGTGYEEWRQEFLRWRSWTRSEIEAWQNRHLQEVVELAATQVPYYREQWRSIDWRAVRTRDALGVLPRLQKQTIRRNEQAFLRKGLNPKFLWVERTGGTSGTSMKTFWSLSMLPKWWALAEVMVRNVAGVGQDIPRAMIGGRPVVPGRARRPPYWRFNRRWRQLYLSSHHISVATASGYVAAIRDHGSQWITGYGSAIAALAESALQAGVAPLPLRAAIVSGDTLTPAMRRGIEAFFQCKCFDSYGQTEGVCLATECRDGRMHVIPAAGIVEITREDGSSCAPGEVGEVVATGLLNDAMPLIRYRLGDYAAWALDQDCPCGNPNPVITDLDGRLDDYLLTTDGRRIGRISPAVRCSTIHSAQIVQDRPGHAFLLVRPLSGYRPADAAAVCRSIAKHVGAFELDIVEVADVPKTPQGKAALVVHLADRPEMKDVYGRLLGRRTLSNDFIASKPGGATGA